MRFRSVLFAPGNRGDVLAKMARPSPDVAVVDWEDAVPESAKSDARDTAAVAVPELARAGQRVFVRVNALDTPHFDDDVAAIPPEIDGIVVPKIESAADVGHIRSALVDAGHDALAIIAGIETAAGVEHVVETARARQLCGVYFGAEDFIADMGGVRTESNDEVFYARSRVVLGARIAGIAAIDQVVADFSDDARFRREAVQARSMGYAGKLCIHPNQVAVANEAFIPSAQEVARARALLAVYDAAVSAGSASIAFEGQMVDEPVARQARQVIELASTTSG